MSYRKAEEVLPMELLREIQQYISGVNLYIPVMDGGKTEWGKKSGYQAELIQRNQKIFLLYQNGMKVSEIAQQFFLSEKSIYRILTVMKSDRLQHSREQQVNHRLDHEVQP